MPLFTPDPAHFLLAVPLQEEKYKFYYGQLSQVVKEFETVMAQVCGRA